MAIAGLDAFEVFQGAMVGEAGGVDPALETVEGIGIAHEGAGWLELRFRCGMPDPRFPEVGIGAAEAAQGPLATDQLVHEETGFGGSGPVVFVVLGLELFEIIGGLPRQDFSFGVDAGDEVGGEDARFSVGGDRAVGFAAVAARGCDLFFGTHEETPRNEKGEVEACPIDTRVA